MLPQALYGPATAFTAFNAEFPPLGSASAKGGVHATWHSGPDAAGMNGHLAAQMNGQLAGGLTDGQMGGLWAGVSGGSQDPSLGFGVSGPYTLTPGMGPLVGLSPHTGGMVPMYISPQGLAMYSTGTAFTGAATYADPREQAYSQQPLLQQQTDSSSNHTAPAASRRR